MKVFKSSNKIFKSPNILKTIWKPNLIPDILFWGNSNKKNIVIGEYDIEKWFDISGKLNHAQQTDIFHQPQYINGALYFNLDSNIQVDLNVDYFTIFTVSKISNDNILYEFGDNVTNETGFRLIGTSNNSLAVSKNGFGDLATTKETNDGNWLSNNNLQLICHQYDGTDLSHNLFINSSYISTTSNYSDNPGQLDSSSTLNIGSRSDYSLGIQGYLYEFIIYNRVLSTIERNQVTNYINDKYSIF